LVFEKNANFFAENWEKSQKILIITSTPDNPRLCTERDLGKELWWKKSAAARSDFYAEMDA
jgi:hypothetical protein